MGSSPAEAFLNAIATDVSVEDFTRALREHPEWLPPRAANPRVAPPPAGELDPILAMSGLSAAEQKRSRREAQSDDLGVRVAAHDTQVAGNLLASTLTTSAAAELLDRDPSNIRRGVQDQRYYAVRVADRLRLPRWQFVEEEYIDYEIGYDAVPDTRWIPLPHLAELVPTIPTDLHPQVVEGFMSTAQADLDDQSPLEWLAGGGGPEPVIALIAGLGHQ